MKKFDRKPLESYVLISAHFSMVEDSELLYILFEIF